MPVKSKAQAAFLGIHRPDVLRKWKAEGASTSTKGLPEHVKGSSYANAAAGAMRRKRKRMG